jgi:hypothetical protein
MNGGTGHNFMHRVQTSHEGGFAAPRGADDCGRAFRGYGHVDAMRHGGSVKERFEIDDAQDFIVEMHAGSRDKLVCGSLAGAGVIDGSANGLLPGSTPYRCATMVLAELILAIAFSSLGTTAVGSRA